jgi:hypothetical protein
MVHVSKMENPSGTRRLLEYDLVFESDSGTRVVYTDDYEPGITNLRDNIDAYSTSKIWIRSKSDRWYVLLESMLDSRMNK